MHGPSLFSADAYRLQFERLRSKARARHRQREPESQGLTLSALHVHAAELCQRVAGDVRSGAFRFAPLQRVETFVGGKRRTIHRADLVDALVLGALAQRLTTLLEGVLRDAVYAYRPGRNAQLAITRLQEHLREHRQGRPDPKQRGVFVLQRDLSAFGESIPTHARSKLWPLLHTLCTSLPEHDEARVLEQLVTAACRPEVSTTDGQRWTLEHGLPTGSPIQQPLANLYLSPLDDALDALGLFYARFGDDLLLISDAPQAATAGAATLRRVCTELELEFNAQKSRDLYFTKPGRPYAGAQPLAFVPASHIEYLGARIAFDGQLGLKRKRLRELLTRTRWRVGNVAQLAAPEEASRAVAQALAHAFFGRDATAEIAISALREWVDDRQQLRQLDRHITLLCAEALSEVRGVRALRHTSAQALRDLGLPSVLQLRRRAWAPREHTEEEL